MRHRGLAGLGAALVATALVAACASAGQRDGTPAVVQGADPPETVTAGPPVTPATPYVIVNTPTGPIAVPRDMAGEIARQHGGTGRDIYEPGTYQGQRHSNDSGGR